MTTMIPVDVLARVRPGHDLEDDPPHALSSASRWTCKRCGRAVLKYAGNIYGSVTEVDCDGTDPLTLTGESDVTTR